jgi:hypothetical protein
MADFSRYTPTPAMICVRSIGLYCIGFNAANSTFIASPRLLSSRRSDKNDFKLLMLSVLAAILLAFVAIFAVLVAILSAFFAKFFCLPFFTPPTTLIFRYKKSLLSKMELNIYLKIYLTHYRSLVMPCSIFYPRKS